MRISKGRLFIITWHVFRWWNWRHRWGFHRFSHEPGTWRLSLGILTIGWNTKANHSPCFEMDFARKLYLNDGIPCPMDEVLTIKGNARIDYDENGKCLGLFVGEGGSAVLRTEDWKFGDRPDEEG